MPSRKDIRKFLDAFNRLESFEATQRIIRGYGAFKDEECPMPEVARVIKWLVEESREC